MPKIHYLYTKTNKIFGEIKYTSEISSAYTKHFHTHLGIALITKGTLHIEYDIDTIQILDNQSLALFNPRQIHRTTSIKAQGYYVLFLDKSWCKEIQKDFYFDTNVLNDITLYNHLRHLFHKAFVTPNLTIEDALKDIIQKMFRLYASRENNEQSAVIENIKSYISSNENNTITVEDIAKYVGYNKSYLIRFFKKEVGMTPQQYILNIKVNRAKDLLTYGKEVSLSTISVDAGFFDQSHMNRNFKGHFGTSPKRYKKVNIIQDTIY